MVGDLMHELSIAQEILSIVERSVPEQERNLVRTVKVVVGEQSGVVADSLQFCFQTLVNDSSMRGARLSIDKVPFTVHCRNCGAPSRPDDGTIVCPACGSMDTEITGGTDLRVLEVELEDISDGVA